MQIGMIKGCTRVLGKKQGFLGLPIRDDVAQGDSVESGHRMVSAWEPTPDEIERLAKGAMIYLTIIGTAHPPVILEVGPEDAGCGGEGYTIDENGNAVPCDKKGCH